jgi:hypothetical protein
MPQWDELQLTLRPVPCSLSPYLKVTRIVADTPRLSVTPTDTGLAADGNVPGDGLKLWKRARLAEYSVDSWRSVNRECHLGCCTHAGPSSRPPRRITLQATTYYVPENENVHRERPRGSSAKRRCQLTRVAAQAEDGGRPAARRLGGRVSSPPADALPP